MASPFNIFRRNQRVMMVVLTGLSMFAFIFFDVSSMRSGGGGTSKVLTVLMIAGLFALGGWFVGQRHNKSQDWATWAGLAGAVAAFLFVWSSGGRADPLTIRTVVKNFTENELRTLGQKRYQTNQFVFRAQQITQSKRPSQGFGPGDERSMLQFALAQQEAKRLGIMLNDDAVNQYITDITDDKLSISDFKKILREINVTQGDLFAMLRAELEARLALEIQTPMYETWTDIFQRSVRPKLPATPEEDWELFRKLNVKESLSVVAVPVSAFLPKIEDPSETELIRFFDERKGAQPGNEGQPGFIQPPRARLAYVAAEFEKFESQATSPTDDEVTAYYEANKARYQIQEIPDLPDSDEPADAANPQNVLIDLPSLDEPKSKDESLDPEKKSDKEPEKSEEKKEEQKEEKKEGDSSSKTKPATIRLVSALTEEKEEATAKKDPAEEAPAEENAKKESEDAPKEDAASEDDEEMPRLDPPKPGKPDKEIRYRPLDDELRAEIREEMLRDRAFEKMGEAVEKAQELMKDLAYVYLSAEDAQKPDAAKEISQKLKDYAKQHQLEYDETSLMSKLELQTSSSEKIGAAFLPTGGQMQFQAVNVAEDVFPRTGQQTPLFFPQRADSRVRDRRYAWWKIEDKPQHVPEWTEEGIAEQVKEAWKYEKGRQMAQTRAIQLMEQAKTEPQNLSAALAGLTVTGETGTESVVIRETPRFSWLTTSMSTPQENLEFSDFLSPRRSFIDGVAGAGDDFMKIVFESLNVGDVGVAVNSQRSVFYLVKVLERDGTEAESDVEGYQTLVDLRSQFLALHADERRSFMARPYNLLMMNTFGQIQQEWTKEFDKRYGVEFDDPEFLPTAGGNRRPRR